MEILGVILSNTLQIFQSIFSSYLKKPASWKPKESSSGENLNSAGSLKVRQPTYINFLQSVTLNVKNE